MTVTQEVSFWNPQSGIFDARKLRMAIILRGWTVVEFARAAGMSPACMYNALSGNGVNDRTAIRIFRGLSQREPMSIPSILSVEETSSIHRRAL